MRKAIGILKPGGKVASIAAAPDPAFAKSLGLNWGIQQVMRLLSLKARRAARKQGFDYSFLFMHADGAQLKKIGELIEAGSLRTVVDRLFPFAETNDALAYVETGRAKGKVVSKVK